MADMGGQNCEREIILVELFPKEGEIPTSMPEVYNRNFELTFESKISYDARQAQKVNDMIDMLKQIDKELPKDIKLTSSAQYQKLLQYQKIDKFTIIRRTENASDAGAILGTADFRPKTIEKRIELGYQDAMASLTQQKTTKAA